MGQSLSKKRTPNMAATHGNIFVVQNREDWDSKLVEGKTAGKVVVVDFTATWCGPCKFIAPFFAELSEKYPQLIYLKVDVDNLSDLSEEMDIRAMPTFLFIKDGQQVDKLVGVGKAELENTVKKFAEKPLVVA